MPDRSHPTQNGFLSRLGGLLGGAVKNARRPAGSDAPVGQRVPVSFDQDDVDAAAASLAYWWRMSFSDDYSDPQCDAVYWDMPARIALHAVAEDRTRNPRGFQHG